MCFGVFNCRNARQEEGRISAIIPSAYHQLKAAVQRRVSLIDGLVATRLIRAEERAAGWAPLPIIGLTE